MQASELSDTNYDGLVPPSYAEDDSAKRPASELEGNVAGPAKRARKDPYARNVYNEQWDFMYERLVQYRAQNGVR